MCECACVYVSCFSKCEHFHITKYSFIVVPTHNCWTTVVNIHSPGKLYQEPLFNLPVNSCSICLGITLKIQCSHLSQKLSLYFWGKQALIQEDGYAGGRNTGCSSWVKPEDHSEGAWAHEDALRGSAPRSLGGFIQLLDCMQATFNTPQSRLLKPAAALGLSQLPLCSSRFCPVLICGFQWGWSSSKYTALQFIFTEWGSLRKVYGRSTRFLKFLYLCLFHIPLLCFPLASPPSPPLPSSPFPSSPLFSLPLLSFSLLLALISLFSLFFLNHLGGVFYFNFWGLYYYITPLSFSSFQTLPYTSPCTLSNIWIYFKIINIFLNITGSFCIMLIVHTFFSESTISWRRRFLLLSVALNSLCGVKDSWVPPPCTLA